MDLAECLLAPAAHYRQEIQVPTIRPADITEHKLSLSLATNMNYVPFNLHLELKPAGNKPNAVGILKYGHTIPLVVFYKLVLTQ